MKTRLSTWNVEHKEGLETEQEEDQKLQIEHKAEKQLIEPESGIYTKSENIK